MNTSSALSLKIEQLAQPKKRSIAGLGRNRYGKGTIDYASGGRDLRELSKDSSADSFMRNVLKHQ